MENFFKTLLKEILKDLNKCVYIYIHTHTYIYILYMYIYIYNVYTCVNTHTHTHTPCKWIGVSIKLINFSQINLCIQCDSNKHSTS